MGSKEKLTEEYLINGWLQKYHSITIEELIQNEPELCKTAEWYKKYAVTQVQHDEWYEWAIVELVKNTGFPKKYVKKNFSFSYLNTAPNVKE